MESLFLGLLALLLGPFIVALSQRLRGAGTFIDSFVLLVIMGLVSLHVLPHAIQAVGWMGLVLAIVGFFAPLWVERSLHGHSGEVRRVVVVLALLGLFLHAAADGIGLGIGSTDSPEHEGHVHGSILAWAVILHRIPIGISIWWIIPRTLGKKVAFWTLGLCALGTVLGFFFGEDLLTRGSTMALTGFESFLAGSLLHVVLHAHVPAVPDARRPRWHMASLLGACAAVSLVGYLAAQEGLLAAPTSGEGPAAVFLALVLESAPALLAAFLLVGLCKAFWIAAPKRAIAAFLLTFQLVGPEFALVRVVAAACIALLMGILMARFVASQAKTATDHAGIDDDGIDEADASGAIPSTMPDKFRTIWRVGFVEMVDHTAAWILVGLAVSALIVPYLGTDFFARLPVGLDVPITALLGLPLYVCALGSTPLAAVLLLRGLSPGAALAFLLTGPATNLSALGVLSRLHGRRTALLFALLVLVPACALGWAVNAFLPSLNLRSIPSLHEGHYGLFHWTSLILLSALFFLALLRMGTRDFLGQLFTDPTRESPAHAHAHGDEGDCCH